MTVEVKTTISFQPWRAPGFALVNVPPGRWEDGIKPVPSIAIADLDEEALEALAAQWLDDLYTKANKPNPFRSTRRVP